MKNLIEITTHDGMFHADEVFAIALLKHYLKSKVNVTRTRDTVSINNAMKSHDVFLIDVGNVYDHMWLNFDHHQDQNLFASNLLIFMHLNQKGFIGKEMFAQLTPFMRGISDYDTNKHNSNLDWGEFNSDNKYRNVSTIISGYNRDPGNNVIQYQQFQKAVKMALEILRNEIHAAEQRIKAVTVYQSREILDNNVAVFNEFCPIWKVKGNHKYAILPNPQGWSLNSCNSKNYPLPDIVHDDLIFAHKGKFIAIFKTKEAAIEIAKSL